MKAADLRRNLTAAALGLGFALLALVAGEVGLRAFGVRKELSPYFGFPRGQRYEGPRHLGVPTSLSKLPVLRPEPPADHFFPLRVSSDNHFCCTGEGGAPVPFPGTHRVRAISETREKIYDVTYTVDAHHNRVVPGRGGPLHAIFLGCSYTFGQGLADEETIPAVFSREAPRFHAYNLALPGNAPNDLLARAEALSPAFVAEPRGVVLYLFLDFHVRRAIGAMSWVGQFGENHPYYYEGPDGRPLRNREFATSRPWWTAFSRFMMSSQLLRYFNVDYPRSIGPSQVDFFASLVEGLRDTYEKKFRGTRFAVVFFPGTDGAARLIPELEKRGIPYLDYSADTLGRYTKGAAFQPDGHPSAEGARAFATALARDASALLPEAK